MGRVVIPVDSAERVGVPLPALTAADAVSQLIWRVLGPSPEFVKPMLAWASGHDPDHDWSASQLAYRIGRVQAIGRRTPLHPAVQAQLQDPGAVSMVRRRTRRLFALPSPPAPSPHPAGWAQGLQVNTRTAVRVLTALGPLTMADLHAAVARTHCHRHTPTPNQAELGAGLTHVGADLDPSGMRWSPPVNAKPWPRDLALLAEAAAGQGAVYSRVRLSPYSTPPATTGSPRTATPSLGIPLYRQSAATSTRYCDQPKSCSQCCGWKISPPPTVSTGTFARRDRQEARWTRSPERPVSPADFNAVVLDDHRHGGTAEVDGTRGVGERHEERLRNVVREEVGVQPLARAIDHRDTTLRA